MGCLKVCIQSDDDENFENIFKNIFQKIFLDVYKYVFSLMMMKLMMMMMMMIMDLFCFQSEVDVNLSISTCYIICSYCALMDDCAFTISTNISTVHCMFCTLLCKVVGKTFC